MFNNYNNTKNKGLTINQLQCLRIHKEILMQYSYSSIDFPHKSEGKMNFFKYFHDKY